MQLHTFNTHVFNTLTTETIESKFINIDYTYFLYAHFFLRFIKQNVSNLKFITMKKKDLKSLKLNKNSISALKGGLSSSPIKVSVQFLCNTGCDSPVQTCGIINCNDFPGDSPF